MRSDGKVNLPRLMVAGTGGDCGKTLVALGLAAAWRNDGVTVVPFKKGPDYIDPAWLTLAAGKIARNLDTWMMGPDIVLHAFEQNATSEGVNLIEANRGLHDGEDSQGTHSSAELAKLLRTPVILVVPAIKVTRTAAAMALGIKVLDPAVEISGVVINQVATARQESVMREAMEREAGLEVIGAIARVKGDLLPSRHLGLVTPEDHERAGQVVSRAAQLIRKSVNLNRLRMIADAAAPLGISKMIASPAAHAKGLRIGFFRNSAFTFYYPENLEAIDGCGAIRIPIDPALDQELPRLDALYIGGGFPETHAASLSANVGFRSSVSEAIRNGLPVWAECGGLMFLSRTLCWKGCRYPMAGVFPIDVSLGDEPAGHGYEEVLTDRPNPFVPEGTILRGHEFHYSSVHPLEPFPTVFQVKRGTGLGQGRDGIQFKNALGCYLHVHALANPQWVDWLTGSALRFRHLSQSL